MIVSSIALKAYVDGITKEVLLSNAAVPWYEVNKDVDVIPEEAADVEIVIRNIMTKEIIRERLPLHNLPKRPERMTRLNINISCIDKIQAQGKDFRFGDWRGLSGNGYIVRIYTKHMIKRG